MSNSKAIEAAALKLCPFCGNDGSGPIKDALHIVHIEDAEHRAYDRYTVQCDKCTATMGFFDSEDEALDAWNTRAIEAAAPILLKAAEAKAAALAAALRGVKAYAENRSTMCPSARAVAERARQALAAGEAQHGG